MRELIESAAPAAFDVRSGIRRFERETEESAAHRVRIDFDLHDGPVHISAEPIDLDRLFASAVLDVSVLMHASGHLTIDVAPDELEILPDEREVVNEARYLHLAVEDDGSHSVGAIFRHLFEPLIVVAPLLANRAGALRWSGKIVLEENDDESRLIHLLLPYAARRETGH